MEVNHKWSLVRGLYPYLPTNLISENLCQLLQKLDMSKQVNILLISMLQSYLIQTSKTEHQQFSDNFLTSVLSLIQKCNMPYQVNDLIYNQGDW